MEQKDLLQEYARHKASLKEGKRMWDEAKSIIATGKAFVKSTKATVAQVKGELRSQDQALSAEVKALYADLKTQLDAVPAEDPAAAKKQKRVLQKECADKKKAIKAQRAELKALLDLCK